MKKELSQLLIRDFPNLYKQPQFHFAIGDGWEPLIRQLSEKLENLLVELPEERRNEYYAIQVKEKFGCLRFYMSSTMTEFDVAIAATEALSAKTCEICGCSGKLRTNPRGWLQILCDSCFEKKTT